MKLPPVIAVLAVVAVPLACSGQTKAPAGAPQANPAVPVLVELFTSEGCSSCPPADRLLTQLLLRQPIRGVQIIGLGEHVDYWNSLGWPDRFSSAAFTKRQTEYQTRVFPANVVYTPQLVVNGRFQAIASDAGAVRRAIEQAAETRQANVSVTAGAARAGRLPVTVHVDFASVARAGPADILVAVVEDGLVSHVARGENQGRTLTHSAVVRRLALAGTIDASRHADSLTTNVPLDDAWQLGKTRIVAFVQSRRNLRVLGSASVAIADAASAVPGNRAPSHDRLAQVR